MRFALTALVLVVAASSADAQLFGRRRQTQQQYCPPGGCQPATPFSAPFAAPLPYTLAPEAPKVMEAPGIPKDVIASFGVKSAARPMHGERAYRIIRAFTERELADQAVKTKPGTYDRAAGKAKARELVGKLTDSNIDDIGVKMAGVSEGIGDGAVGDRIDNIIRIIEAIMKLLMLFL